MKDIVIYTDLDGSLLDHDSYSHAAADALLEELRATSIPVVPVTSKTRQELLAIREELNNAYPFICENGALVCIPEHFFPAQPKGTTLQEGFWIKTFVQPRQHWLHVIDHIKARFIGEMRTFSDLSIEEIQQLTGLNRESAIKASAREYGEPVHWSGTEASKAEFISALEQQGANVLQGGRFLHVSGACDKGAALQWLNNEFGKQGDKPPPFSIAIGDSPNDLAMLEAADYALVIRSPNHEYPIPIRTKPTMFSTAYGPAGWCEGVRKILNIKGFYDG